MSYMIYMSHGKKWRKLLFLILILFFNFKIFGKAECLEVLVWMETPLHGWDTWLLPKLYFTDAIPSFCPNYSQPRYTHIEPRVNVFFICFFKLILNSLILKLPSCLNHFCNFFCEFLSISLLLSTKIGNYIWKFMEIKNVISMGKANITEEKTNNFGNQKN